MKLRAVGLASLAAVTALCTTSLAHAQRRSTQKHEDGYIYKFKDDPLEAQGAAATGWVLKVRQPAARSTLIRPRVSFVTEMFKSVEKL